MTDSIYFETGTININNNDIQIINNDVLTTQVDNSSIDLIVTSPPYNLDMNYNSTDDDMAWDSYLKFTQGYLAQCYEWLKSDGRMCLNIPLDKNKGGQVSFYADIVTLAKQAGFKYQSTIVWNEGNISRRTAWGSWMRASAPYVIAPVEMIVILYKDVWKKTSGTQVSDIERDEFMQWTNGMWTFNGESAKRIGHPAPYPVELSTRLIKLFSFVEDTVLDPFMGSGTTLVSCIQNKRKGIGIDVDSGYCELAKQRVQLAQEELFNNNLEVVVEEGS